MTDIRTSSYCVGTSLYDAEIDALYINLIQSDHATRVMLDVNGSGAVVGIEILGASQLITTVGGTP